MLLHSFRIASQAILLLTFLFITDITYGQQVNGGDQRQGGFANAPQGFGNNLNTAEFKGALQDFDGQRIQLLQEDGGSIIVGLPERGQSIRFVADLKPTQLQQGLLVRFRTNIESVQNDSLSATNMDVFPQQDQQFVNRRNQREAMNVIPGIYPLAQMGVENSSQVQIVGVIIGLKENVLTINVGQSVSVQVSEETTYQFTSRSLEFAKQGDEVTGSGIYSPAQPNMIMGSQITIRGSFAEENIEDLKQTKKKSKAKSKRLRNAKSEEATSEDAEAKPQEKASDSEDVEEKDAAKSESP